MIVNRNAVVSGTHYFKHVHKVPMYDSEFTGSRWVDSVLGSRTDTRCLNAFRMDKRAFKQLCLDLHNNYGLQESHQLKLPERVGMFLYLIAHGLGYRAVAERFQRSTKTVSDVVHKVLDAIVGRKNGMMGMASDLLRPRDPSFSEIPAKILNDERYEYFKGAIGCIDGTHISASPPAKESAAYRGRKGDCTFNVMAVCDFDMYFTFVSAGWEGSAHDARVLDHATRTPGVNFPHPPPGKLQSSQPS